MPNSYELQAADSSVVKFQEPESTKDSDLGVGIANEEYRTEISIYTDTQTDRVDTKIEKEMMDLSAYDGQSSFEDLERPTDSKIINFIDSASKSIRMLIRSPSIKLTFIITFAIAFYSYIGLCIWQFVQIFPTASDVQKEASIRLFWVTGLITLIIIGRFVHRLLKNQFDSCVKTCEKVYNKLLEICGNKPKYIWYCVQVCIIIGFMVWVGITNSQNLISFVGMAVLLLIAFISSRDHAMINLRPVLGGIVLQLIFAVLVLKTQWGFIAFEFLGNRVSEFLVHVDAGAAFVFGAQFRNHFFAFSVLSIVVFFYSITTVLFHWGVLTYLIEKIGRVMQFVMGTSTTESLVAAANIFVGMTEAPLMIAPFLTAMTNAEIHSIMTSGFATIAGSVLAAYVGMGVPAKHLIGASVMSAPAALAVSKLMFPETKKTVIKPEVARKVKMEKYSNFLEAAGVGAMNAVAIVAAIAVNLIAFISILAFLNATLTWLGHRAGLEVNLTFELISSYVLWPLAFVMGVPSIDCLAVAELIGVKTFVNEFVAYERMSTLRANYVQFMNLTRNGTLSYNRQVGGFYIPGANATFTGNVLFEDKSIVIATYSLCGFSNMGSIGILIGALSALAPNRRRDIVNCVITAMIGGNIACFLTACIAGLFYEATP